MRALWVFHFPVYGGPHNTAVGVKGPLADLGWETIAALTDEPGNAEQRLTEGGLETVTMPLQFLPRWTRAQIAKSKPAATSEAPIPSVPGPGGRNRACSQASGRAGPQSRTSAIASGPR